MNPAAQAVRKKNARRILDYILCNGETSRALLAKALSISTGTVTNIVTELIEQGLLREGRREPSSSGNKTTLLEFNESLGIIICCNISLHHITLTSCSPIGKSEHIEKFSFDPVIREDHTEIEVVRDIIELVRHFIATFLTDEQQPIKAIGISVCGMVNSHHLIDAPSINWKNINLIIPMQASLGIAVFCEGITRIKAFYEMRFIRPEEKNIIYLNLYDGVGMVNFFNGKMVVGKTGIAGEVGHMSLNLHGPQCYCGNRGCFELYCSMPPVMIRARELLTHDNENDVFYDMVVRQGREITPELLFEAKEAGSLVIYTLLCSVAEYLGVGLAALYNIYDPDRMILSGYRNNEEDFITERAKEEARSRIINHFSRDINITSGRLSNRQLHLAICAYVVANLLDLRYK